MGNVGRTEISSAARGKILFRRKMDATRRTSGGVCGARGTHSNAKSRLRMVQPTGIRLPTVPHLLYKNCDHRRAKRIIRSFANRKQVANRGRSAHGEHNCVKIA